MNSTNLSFSALPPINVPFRHFISACVFLMLAALVILVSGEESWLSRWQPSMLAIIHLFTLGFVSMVMMGAIYQFLPVIGGVGIPNVRLIANICHSLHVLGSLALASSFVLPNAIVRWLALITLAMAWGLYVVAVANVLIKKLSQGHTIIGLRLALLSLVFVLILGLLFVANNTGLFASYFIFLQDKNYTDIHALFGGFGWAGLLIISVSLQIIPMFHVTPNFPKLQAKYLPSLLFLLLLALFALPPSSQAGQLLIVSILLVFSVFNLSYLRLFRQRKRKVADTSIKFWQFAGVSFLVLVLFYCSPDKWLVPVLVEKKSFLLAAVFLYFYLISIIEAMLLKIIPFLTYTHLQNLCLTNFNVMAHLPNMQQLLLKSHGRWLFILHVLCCALLLLTIVFPKFYVLLALAVMAEFSWLLFLILRSLHHYQACLSSLENSENC
ncbi:hypothetical protein SAMN05216262_10835 [Colwellia chukchiensis]|uniref:NnrS protein n=1 Tax=Colwellia chukchiensis TaxID=641665 RepID=A0A1H7NMZ0_9GAMM|nr:hypothetical protein [Colwellia chukchiensis]SEL24930.1 hypothetical protein SAMN05216262_10835 [Colwellia chukchiensis]